MPRNYIGRRRRFRRIKNVALITVLSGTAAYVISRPIGGTGFSPPQPLKKTDVSIPPAMQAATSSKPAPPVGASSLPQTAFEKGYKLGAGPLNVTEVSDIVLHDAKRNRDLHMRIFYPREEGTYPVIVFSHGAGGSQSCCDALTSHWASYGYVTIQPTHDDSAVQRRNADEENVRFMQAVSDALKRPAFWVSRPRDIFFVLDSLSALGKRFPGLAEKMDADHVGVGGHSMGSYTTEAIAGALIDLPGHPAASFADPRVKAVLCLSPQGPGQFGLNDHSFDPLQLPYMGVTGSLDSLGPVASPAWHKTPFLGSQPGDKYHLFIAGANHMSFITARTLLPARAAQAEAILGYTNSASLAFWDAYLKSDERAKQYLRSEALANSSHGAAKLSRR